MSVRRRHQGDIAVLDIGGRFFGDRETDDLEKVLEGEATRGTRRVLLNPYDCSMMNSTALGVMFRAKQKLESVGAEVRLCGLGSRMQSLLVVTRLMEWFTVHDTEKEAIEAFTNARAGA